ncbi:triacylglycerol lipase domain protein [Leptospira broomii serovar Hurstbridge str. 5399]|uniref:Triacylglycerol lipase domain protein n=1 Tax=Leptospira broomii serovar Hurstbridge str. 5399 TaxID=1049789 RepID=T0FCX7_9LEPT|nr:alpha/beta fold hydrolase [Leptospira broomii]EQA45726.1 triacylglycerol lipase domain protein [Leptospira broomii serovar Hurstbridge str. 5399]
MRKLGLSVLILFIFSGSLFASGGGSSSKPLAGAYPIILSHGLFGWGTDSSGIISIISYWGGMDSYLTSQGATVYAPTKTAAQSNETRGVELANKINVYMAANGFSKVHILGHSQGGLDSRYAISNLGLSSKVSTLTTLNTPHRGSPIADIINTVLPDWIKPFVNAVLGVVVQLVYGGGQQNALAALGSLTTSGTAAFNTRTPNSSAVKYYSYGSYITIPDLIQHPLMGILQPACAAGGLFNGQGATCDGLVPYSSLKWGTFNGGPSYGILTTGVDHLEASNTLNSGKTWYDVEGYFLKMAQNAKSNQ